MIDSREFSRRARDLGVREDHVKKDYVLNHVLASLSEKSDGLYFRGGTALARVYWPDFRLSEDLDFIMETLPPQTGNVLEECVVQAAERTGWNLELRSGDRRRGRHRFLVASDVGEVLIDILSGERPVLPADPRILDLPYSDLIGEFRIPTLSLAEILGDKWYMLDDADRREPRDLYDLWAGLRLFNVSFDLIAQGHTAKYRYFPLSEQLRRAERLEGLWTDRLSYQLADLPTFDEALRDVTAAFEEWKEHQNS